MNDDKKNWPQWLKDADTQNANVSIDSSGYVTWLGGLWLGGLWHDGWCEEIPWPFLEVKP